MTITQITTHEALALARVIEQYKDKPRILSLITSNMVQVQALEDVLFDMITSRAYANAVGDQLDLIGEVVGIARTAGDDDAAYRLDIGAKINQNIGSGTPEDVIDAVTFLTGATVVDLRELFPAAAQATVNVAVPNDQAADILSVIQGLMPAGVAMDHVVAADADNAFCFEDGDGGGFGDRFDLSVGGEFASLIGGLDESEEVPLATKNYTASFVSATVVDIDTSLFTPPMDATKCMVQVLDATVDSDPFDTSDIFVNRPDVNTIRLTSGIAITKELRVLIVETED